MVEDARDLGEEHADVLRARRRLDAEQLLDRERVGMLLAHRRDIVEPVEIGHRLEIGLVLDQLLGAAMEEADMRIGTLHDLAVHLEDEAQHAVGRRMLRPEIHGEALDLGLGLGAHDRSSFAFSSPGRIVAHAFPRRQEIEAAELLLQAHRLVDDALLLLVVAQLDIAGERKVLAQRMALEAVIGEDAPEIGMVGEIDAVEIPGLALEPAGGAEDAGRGRHRRLSRRSVTLSADAAVVPEAQEIIDDVEALRRDRDNRRRRYRPAPRRGIADRRAGTPARAAMPSRRT